jgi:transcription elongation factor Elf1
MSLIHCKKCDGMVVEADKVLDKQKHMTEFLCLMCGNSFEFSTQKYLRVLDALGVDYSRRVK